MMAQSFLAEQEMYSASPSPLPRKRGRGEGEGENPDKICLTKFQEIQR